MSTSPKVSVIIPVYNTEEYLNECLDSVVKQTLSDIEIICIDDGSTDRSMEILKQYAEKDCRFAVLSQQNSGSGAARNNGIRTARGEYVVFMDSDDYYPERMTLEKLYNAATEHDSNICGGSFSSFKEDGIIVTQFSEKLKGYTFSESGEMLYKDYQFDYGYHRFLYRREFLVANSIFFPDYLRYQDPPFFVRAMITSEKFYAITDVTYRYRKQPRSISTNDRKTLDVIKGLTDILEMAVDNNLDDLYRLTVDRCCVDNWSVILSAEKSENDEIHNALVKLNELINPKKLNSEYSDAYKLHYIKDFGSEVVRQDNSEADLIRKSASYKIGRIITWLPRKIRGH